MTTIGLGPFYFFIAALVMTILALLSLCMGSFPAGKSAWMLRQMGLLDGSIIRRSTNPGLYWLYWSVFAGLAVFFFIKAFLDIQGFGLSVPGYVEFLRNRLVK